MKRKTEFTYERKGQFYYLKDNMMIHEKLNWGSDGRGDALWRTAYAWLVYLAPELLIAIKECLKYPFKRNPWEDRSDFSRDQLIPVLCAYFLNGLPIPEIPKKISGKFKVDLLTRLWIHAIQGSVIGLVCFSFISMLLVPALLLWNLFLYQISGIKIVHPEDHDPENVKSETKLQKLVFNIHYPAYAFHLFCWQFYVLDSNIFKIICEKLCLWLWPDRSNYVIRLLLNDTVDFLDVANYQHMSGMRWQCLFIEGQSNAVRIIKDPVKYNCLDNDILWYLFLNK